MSKIEIRDVWGSAKGENWFESFKTWLVRWRLISTFGKKDPETVLAENQARFDKLPHMEQRKMISIDAGLLQYARLATPETDEVAAAGPPHNS